MKRSKQSLTGRPVRIVEPQADHTFKLNSKALSSILLDNEIKDKKVVLISITGAFRTGKSFLLNIILNYLRQLSSVRRHSVDSQFADDVVGADWLSGDPKWLEQGFSWCHGDQRDTDGVVMWSEPFLIKTKEDDLAVLLLDTQGSFDETQTTNDCAVIFALATLFSSCQVYNIVNNIREDDISNLLYFTQYGKLATEEEDNDEKMDKKVEEKLKDFENKPFQRLIFLIRDWKFPTSFPYGSEGGSQKLQQVLKVTEKTNEEALHSRDRLKSYFEQVECFLMPHPGLKVATGESFSNATEDIESAFLQHLKPFCKFLLDDNHLRPKKIAGSAVTAGELFTYIESYMKVVSSGALPTLKNCYLATAEATHLNAETNALEYYHKSMQNACGGSKPYVNEESLQSVHGTVSKAAVKQFKASKRMGGSIFGDQFLNQLKTKMDEAGKEYLESNRSKKGANRLSTPMILAAYMALFSFIWTVADFFRIHVVAEVVEKILWILMILMIVWWTISITGKGAPVQKAIDRFSQKLWKRSFALLMKSFTAKEHLS